jgi:uncharacterized membrane protein
MLWLVLGLIFFLGIHSVSIVAPQWRDATAARLGEMPWKGLYSVLAIAGFVMLIVGYGTMRQSPTILYTPPNWTRYLAMLLMVPVFPLLLATYLPGRIKAATKHPMLASVKLWALAHLLANGTLADVLLFGGFLAWAVVDSISMKRRPQRAPPAAPALPSNDLIAIAGGLALYALLVIGAHRVLTGVPLV